MNILDPSLRRILNSYRLSAVLATVGVVLVVLSLESGPACASVTGVEARKASGQVFVTWTESGAGSYDIYRSDRPITSLAGLDPIYRAAQGSASIPRLTQYDPAFKKGGVPSMGAITRVCLEDFNEVPAGTGVFVRDCDETGEFYYAVLEGGGDRVEPGTNATTRPVAERPGLPPMVQVSSFGDDSARMYMYFMDNPSWDSDDGHFAYLQQVILPKGYDSTGSYPLWVSGHGWGDGGSKWVLHQGNGSLGKWNCIRIVIDDFRNTWYFGNKNVAGTQVGNYTEARVIQGIQAVLGDPPVGVDTERIYFKGHSMGGSGAIAFAMRYPDIFAACFSSKGMTDYDPPQWGSANWSNDVSPKWGAPADALPLKIVGRWSGHLKRYEGTPAYDWQNHQKQIVQRSGDEMAFFVTTHGTLDTVVPWVSQGEPWYPIAANSGHGFCGYYSDSEHSGADWHGAPNFAYLEWGREYSPWNKFAYRKSYSFPGIIGGEANNRSIRWGCPWLKVAGVDVIVDEPNQWSIVLATDGEPDTIGLVPRRLQRFQVRPGASYQWEVTEPAGGAALQSGQVVADENGIVIIPDGSIELSSGGRRVTVRPAP